MEDFSANSLSEKESFDWSVKLTKQSAGNFYYSFLTLPTKMFEAMCVLYAFLRVTDDIADNLKQPVKLKSKQLDDWQHQLALAVHSQQYEHQVYPALVSIIKEYSIPVIYLHDVIEGVRSDLTPRKFENFEQLDQYCYQVAGAVGLCCIEIWGYNDPKAKEYALACGTAFQLTNILRDLGADAKEGRFYLPAYELKEHSYSENDLVNSNHDSNFNELMAFQVKRNQSYYEESKQLIHLLTPEGKAIFSAMSQIYEGVLKEIIKRDYDIFSARVRIPKWKKLYIAMSSLVRHRWFG
jgi:15-cis-phytoene synthase